MTTRRKRWIDRHAAALRGAAGVLILAIVPVAEAAPLEPEACTALTGERTNLLSQGVEADMAKGAAWARQTLTEERLRLIKRLIEVNEQLSFRCGIMVTERPTLIQRTPPTQAAAEPAGEDSQTQKKPTKSKPKPAATQPPAGLPGQKPTKPKEAAAPAARPVAEAKNTAPAKEPPAEKAGN